MNPLDHPVNTCLALGHLYMNTLVVRCPHLEGVAVTTTVWRDLSSDDVHMEWSETVELGPFDTSEDVAMVVATLSAQGARRMLLMEHPSPRSL